jgi:peptidoglycan/xylan/chitin deacetylase (PgdA/CDA1 family)
MTAAGQGGDLARTVILNFHGIGTPGRRLEPGEARFWVTRDACRAILDAAAAARDDGRAVQITFDDGNRSDLEIGVPELARRGLSATFFVLAGRLGTPGSLAADDLRALVAAGHRIGLHGYDHVDWRGLDADGAVREFETARTVLAAAAGVPIVDAAVPFGRYDRGVLRALRSRGIAAVYTSDRGTVRGEPWIRPRNCVRSDMGPEAIQAILTGRESAARRIRRALGVARKRLL